MASTRPPGAPAGVADGSGHPERWRALPVSALGVFLVVTALTSLNVALPDLQDDLSASTRDLQWIVDAYAVVFGGLLLTGGAVGDRLGRRPTLLAGFAVLAAANLMAASADSVAQIIVARAGAGVGAALMLPATLAVLTDLFDGAEQARAIAIWSGIAGAGGAIGPALGGLLIDRAGWPSVFLLTATLAAAGLTATAFLVPTITRPPARKPDPLGSLLSVVAVGGVLFAAIEAPAGVTDPLVLAAIVVAIAASAAFVLHERRTPWPLLPLGVFADRRLRSGAGTLLLAAVGFNGVLFVASLLLQLGWGESALATGLLLVPIGVVEFGIATRSVWLAERFGEPLIITAGLGLMAAGYLGLAATPSGNRTMLVVAGVLAGVGNGLVIPLSVGRVVGGGSAELAGVRAGINETAIELGASLGVAVLGGVQRVVFARGLPGGINTESLPAVLAETDATTAISAFETSARVALVVAAAIVVAAVPIVFSSTGKRKSS